MNAPAQHSRKSRVPIWCEIVCGNCSRSCTAANRYTFARIERNRMVAAAKKSGWVFKYDEAFCSVNCRAIYENSQATHDVNAAKNVT